MKNSFKELPGSIIDLEIILDGQEFDEYWQSAYSQALAETQIKGFRPGAAPKELADHTIDKDKVFEKATQAAVRQSLNSATEENGWTIIDQPKIEILEASPLADGKTSKIGLKYKAELTVFPKIKVGDYRKIAAKVLTERKDVGVEPNEIEKTLEWIRQSRATLTRVNRVAERGDLVEADVQSILNGKPIENGALKGDRFVLGESRYLPGFDDELIKHAEGESVNFSITAPDNYWQKDLSGKKIEFKVEIKAVFERKLPELNDEFARGLGSNFQNIEGIKKSLSQGIAIEKETKEKERLRAKIIDEIAKSSKIDPPQIMINKTLENMIAEVKQMVLRGMPNKYSDEELKTQLLPRAKERVLANLVVHQIIQTERLEPTEEEIKAEAEKEKLDPETNYDYIYEIIRNRKLFEFLEK
ncbi:MAG TPA: trigger factor [Candidatus Paceibacterota bacterium]